MLNVGAKTTFRDNIENMSRKGKEQGQSLEHIEEREEAGTTFRTLRGRERCKERGKRRSKDNL